MGDLSDSGRVGLEDVSVPEHDASSGPDFIIAPIPFANPTLGLGLGGVAALLYHVDPNDTDSPPSTTGVGAFASDNGSWGAGVVQKLYLFEDRDRVLAAAGYADVSYDFYGIGPAAGEQSEFVPLNQGAAFGVAEWLTRIAPDLYLGPRVAVGQFSTSIDRPAPPDLDGLEPSALDAMTSSLGLRSEFDSRDNTFYPTLGTYLDLRADFFDESWGSDFEYQAYSVAYNGFWSLSDKQVLAIRGYGRGAAGDVPYFGLSFFGTGADLRGYPAGVYQDRLMIAAQAEYRLQFSKSWGVVAFAGAGQIAGEFDEFSASTDEMLPSIGAGIRYMLSQENRINFRVDIAVGKDSTALYLGVGEAF